MPSELIGDLEIARKANFIVSNFDINSLFKVKFLKSKTDFSHIEDRLNQFFGLDNIYQFGNNKTFPAFSRTRRSSNNLMRDFWVKSAFTHFERINNPYDFDREALVELLPKIRPYTMNIDNGLFIVAQALYIVGVTVIFQPNLPSVQVRGATFLCNKKPCIVLTDYNKNYPTIWFALLHELCHVLYDLESLEKNVFHMTGEPDLFLVNEDFANDFAREYLFSSEKSSYIAPFINDKLIVSEYAKESQVHPSFVYNFYNYDQYLKGDSMAWSRYKEFFPDVSRAVKILNTNPWGKDSIDESAELLKENIFNLN
jgi:Zn-dependent peptidase ImmA (M78 family)